MIMLYYVYVVATFSIPRVLSEADKLVMHACMMIYHLNKKSVPQIAVFHPSLHRKQTVRLQNNVHINNLLASYIHALHSAVIGN